MITTQQFIENLTGEFEIIKHLAAKVTPDMLDYRPSENQRSTLELLQYLGHIFMAGTLNTIGGGDMEHYKELRKAADGVTYENFAAKMDEQAALVQEKIGALTASDLEKELTIFGRTQSVAIHLLGMLKWASAYKMQLFLYLKANGTHDIGTSNVWAGRDMPPKA